MSSKLWQTDSSRLATVTDSSKIGPQPGIGSCTWPECKEVSMRIVRALVFIFGFVAALQGSAALAETYPSKPVRLIVTYPPAGSSDLMGRILGQKLAELWGQPVIVENKPGAAGSIGMDYAAHQPDRKSVGEGRGAEGGGGGAHEE